MRLEKVANTNFILPYDDAFEYYHKRDADITKLKPGYKQIFTQCTAS